MDGANCEIRADELVDTDPGERSLMSDSGDGPAHLPRDVPPELGDPARADYEQQLLEPFGRALRALNDKDWTPERVGHLARKRGLKSSGRATMYAVAACDRLPTAPAVTAWVTVTTDGDKEQVDKFVTWRHDIFAQLNPGVEDTVEVDDDTQDAPDVTPAPPRWRWKRDGVLVVGTAVVTAIIAVLVTLAVSGNGSDQRAAAAAPSVVSGDDPDQKCNDSIHPNGDVVTGPLTLAVVYSESCQAVWGKVVRNDNLGYTNSITVEVYREGHENDPGGTDRYSVTERNVGNAYTPVIVRTSPVDHICVRGSVTVDLGARTIAAPTPQCT